MDIPKHLQYYIVDQGSENYTPEDHAVWRYTMRQLIFFLSKHAHPSYLNGLKQTKINADKIPLISDIDSGLQNLGWRAVPVSGFIPPAIFMEFQSHSILPIASQMRSLENILYTPAPDILHEAAGHAPILANKEYSQYLKQYAQVASKSIISNEDIDLYRAIRSLSDIKESSQSSPIEIKNAMKHLEQVAQNMTYTSEVALLGRMNWWTAEYGLIGSIDDPKIFGAGLLSSIGESKEYLSKNVKKKILDLKCVDYSYDITEPQPQLFVTPSFTHLEKILHEFEKTLSFSIGGLHGLKQAQKAKTLNTVELNSGLQISGILDSFLVDADDKPIFIKFSSPTQLCFNNKELVGHGKEQHYHGYSNPLGTIKNRDICDMDSEELKSFGIREKQSVELCFDSGIKLFGKIKSLLFNGKKLILIKFTNCKLTYADSILFHPDWGDFDFAPSVNVASVYGGLADPKSYGVFSNFTKSTLLKKIYTKKEIDNHNFYFKIRELRNKLKDQGDSQLKNNEAKELAYLLFDTYKENHSKNWLMGLEILEIYTQNNLEKKPAQDLNLHLNKFCVNDKALNQDLKTSYEYSKNISTCVESGLKTINFEI